jgi:hypothetical protein
MNTIKEKFLEKSISSEILEVAQCIENAERVGLLVEVIYTALDEMKSNPQSSILLCLQIALNDWDC